MKKILLLVMLASGAAWAAPKPRIAGDWAGILQAGTARLHLILHVHGRANGTMTASLDSVNQGANGIPIATISLKGVEVSFSAPAIHGYYHGTLSPDGQTIRGTWTQGQNLPLNFQRLAKPAKPVKPSDIDGVWEGLIQTPGHSLKVIIHVFNTEAGLRATMDVPDQGAFGVPIHSISRQGAQITLMAPMGARYAGTINTARTAIQGVWSQNGGNFQLVLARVAGQTNRPQTPKGPFPYRQKLVQFANPAAGIRLAGTLTLPRGPGPFPAVVLIDGSGPHGRDETIFGHKPFLVLADYLTRRNIAVLRYDKRGVGQSGGQYATATTADFASDAEAAFNFLRAQPGINPREVGLIGHSEGGAIAPIVAARNRRVAFIVLMAGPGVIGSRLLIEQERALSLAMGASASVAATGEEKMRQLYALAAGPMDTASLNVALKRQLLADQVPPQKIALLIKAMDSPWMRYFLRYDPAPTLERVRCPVLALGGSKDLQVPAEQNLGGIRRALIAGGNRHFEVKEMAGLNHLFQPAHTGLVSEYATIPITIAPAALVTITRWVKRQAGAGRPLNAIR